MSSYIAWWNLENLFDVENNAERSDKLKRTLAKELEGWNDDLLAKKISQLAKTIRKMNGNRGPDIMGVCEVENRHVLELLREAIEGTGGHNYDIIHADTQDDRGIDVAFMYDTNKFEVEPNKVFFHFIVKRVATRDIVQVNFKAKSNGSRLVLVGNHWPSRSGGELESEPYRIIAGETLAYFNQRIQEEHGKNTATLVMGDFNDEPFNKSITNHALGTASAKRVEGARDAPRLLNLMWPMMSTAQGTYFHEDFNLLDQFMVSKGMIVAGAKFSVKPTSVQILTTTAKGGRPRKFGRPRDPQGIDEDGYSDHFPIVLELN
jgi:predicted extracellular nuclease